LPLQGTEACFEPSLLSHHQMFRGKKKKSQRQKMRFESQDNTQASAEETVYKTHAAGFDCTNAVKKVEVCRQLQNSHASYELANRRHRNTQRDSLHA